MHEVLKQWAVTAAYTVSEGERRVDYAVGRGLIDPDTEAVELLGIVRQHGTPEELTAEDMNERISENDVAFDDLATLVSDTVCKLMEMFPNAGFGELPEEEEPEEPEEPEELPGELRPTVEVEPEEEEEEHD